jgi:hypothetical protein
VKKEDQLLFSKKKMGRFPDPQEILAQLQS